MTLRQRIVLTVTPLVLLLAGLGSVGSVLLIRLGQRSDAILRENYDSVRAMNRINEAIERIDSSFESALAGRENEARTAYHEHWLLYCEQLAIEEHNVTIYPDEPKLFAELKDLTTKYQTQGDEFYSRIAGDLKRRDDYFGAKGLQSLFNEIKRVSLAIHDLNESQMQRASQDAKETARVSAIGFMIGLAASVLLAIVAVWWLQRTLLEPIQAVTEAATAIGGGQLHLMVPVQSRDEVGRLAEAFNAMTVKLRVYRQTNTERLLRARQTGQSTIDSFPDPVLVIDTLGRIELANPAAQRVLGVKPPPDDDTRVTWQPPESLRQPVDEALRQQRAVLTETFDKAVIFRLDGDDRVFLPQVRPIRSPDGELLGAAVVLDDVTRFRLLDRLKSDWVATVSHELKTPLTSVRLVVHVLLEEIVGTLEPKQVELLIEARENTERLLKLIEHLLSLAKLEDGYEELDLKPTDPSTLLRAAADDVATRAEDKRIQVVVESALSLPTVNVDSDRLGRALNNLLDNAITYTETGGTVTLTATQKDPAHITLIVADTGIGIPAEYLPHVFDRFFRVPGRDGTPGTGLGLAIVREIVIAHGGEITCESEVGHGTTFIITLPASAAP